MGIVAMKIIHEPSGVEVLLRYTPDGNPLILWGNNIYFPGSSFLEKWHKLLNSEANGVFCSLKKATPLVVHTGEWST